MEREREKAEEDGRDRGGDRKAGREGVGSETQWQRDADGGVEVELRKKKKNY